MDCIGQIAKMVAVDIPPVALKFVRAAHAAITLDFTLDATGAWRDFKPERYELQYAPVNEEENITQQLAWRCTTRRSRSRSRWTRCSRRWPSSAARCAAATA